MSVAWSCGNGSNRLICANPCAAIRCAMQEIEDVTSSAPGPCSHVLDVTAASKGDKRQHFHSQWPDRLACTRVSLATQVRLDLAAVYVCTPRHYSDYLAMDLAAGTYTGNQTAAGITLWIS